MISKLEQEKVDRESDLNKARRELMTEQSNTSKLREIIEMQKATIGEMQRDYTRLVNSSSEFSSIKNASSRGTKEVMEKYLNPGSSLELNWQSTSSNLDQALSFGISPRQTVKNPFDVE